VSSAAIERGWDELLRLTASIRWGRVSATLALQRFGSSDQGDHCTKPRSTWADCCGPCSCATTSPSRTFGVRSHPAEPWRVGASASTRRVLRQGSARAWAAA
jgi:hypothetical protein